MEDVDLSSWRVALNGAEHAVPEVMRAFTARFERWGLSPAALTPVYGLSEASLAVTFSDIHRPFVAHRFDRELLAEAGIARDSPDGREIASVGQPVPGVELRIVGQDGDLLPEGEVGLIECRGPSLMKGYLGQPGATERALRDGWLNTGDLGFLWCGELYLAGRSKEMLLLRGRNYSPQEVERVAETVPGIRAGCVVAATWLPEGAEGERLVVLAEARHTLAPTAFDATARACQDAVVSALGLAPDRVVVLPPGTLPRTSSGKLRRQDALRQFLTGTLSSPRRVTRLSLAAALTRSSIAFLRSRWGGRVEG
jgi:acyl-CoA synthetase (AMP-forming)/AMP-acid ligase II